MRVLLVEDDRDLARAIEYRLKKEGMQVVCCLDGQAGLAAATEGGFDLVALDRMLPGMDGVTILQTMRARKDYTPVLLLTAMDGVLDRVVGLDAGADDYLVKPFAMEELLARLRALGRRRIAWNPQGVAQAADLTLDTELLTLHCREKQVSLSRRESNLMEFFLYNFGRVLPRSIILDRVWSGSFVEEGSLEIYVHFLRKHLKALGSQAAIHTARGVGYRLDAQ